MLHLAIIGIVCAISAPNEDASFIGQKNNESVFCHFEKEQNIAKVFLPSYNVDVYNSSGCVKQKITNRTNSFFYDYIINQYQDSKNCSCSIIKNAFLKKEKKPHSNVEFAFKKRNLLWIQHNSKFATKTLRPVIKEENFKFQWLNDEDYKSKKYKMELKTKSEKKLKKMHDECNLNSEQKRILLRLKNTKRRLKVEKLFPKHLDKIRVVDESDLNRRIEKLVKEVALENQKKEKYFTSYCTFMKNDMSDSSREEKVRESLFNSIKKLFCFYKNSFKNKKRDADDIINSFPVNKVRGKDSIAEKMTLRSNSDISKTKGKARIKRNPYSLYDDFSDPTPIRRQNFIDIPYPYSTNFKGKRCFLPPPYIGQVFPEIERMRSRPRNSLENWPFFKKLYFDKQNIRDWRLKRFDRHTVMPTSLPATEKEDSTTMSDSKETQETEKSIEKTMEGTHPETSSAKVIEYVRTTEETTLSSITSSEDLRKSTKVNLNDAGMTQKDGEDMFPDCTIERPYLKRDLENEKLKYHRPDPNFDDHEFPYYNFMTDFPILDSNYFQQNLKYKYGVPDYKYLRPFHFLQIRHALRNYIARNNVWSPYDRYFSFERKKRCGGKRCSMPRKCWRSAPLLCVPYIKKSQEDVLKYLIRIMQKMIGKPLPMKRDIFENTKFKPFVQKGVFSGCENMPEEDVCEGESEAAPVSHPEYLDLCPPPSQPLYCPNSKSCPVNSPSPSCLSFAANPQFYAASPFPPYFPIFNPGKVNSEFVKSFSYANFNPLQLRQSPRINSWPPDISFYVPHMEQIENLSPIHNEEKLATTLSQPTSSAPVSTAVATSVTSEMNTTNSSQILVSLLVNSEESKLSLPNTTISNASITFSSSSSFTDFVSQSASTTSATLLSTDFERMCLASSTKSACSLYVSSSPVEQEEHFSYTAVPYNGESESATVNDQNSEAVSLMPSDQKPYVYNTSDSHCDACFPKVENTSPINQQLLEWPSATDPSPTTETFPYQSQIIDTPRHFKELYESSKEYPQKFNQFKKDDRNQIFDPSKSNDDLVKSFQYILHNSENPQKSFFRMKHKKISKTREKSQPTDFLPYYDYYLYDKYPLMRPNENNMKFGKYPIPQLPFWKDFERKMKTSNNFKSLIRRKRKDYDFGSDDFDSYNEYLDDTNYSDEDLKEFSEPYVKSFTRNYLESGDTSPSYEMLSELAKILTESNATKLESSTPVSKATTALDSTNQSTKPRQNGDSVLQMAKSNSNKTLNKAKANKKSLSQSNSKSSNYSKAFANNTLSLESYKMSLTTAATENKTTIKDRAMDSKKSGKSSFFQTNSKIMQNSKNSKKDSGKEEKESESNKVTKTTDEGQIPTTLKTATIVKGQKKSFTKPSTKVYPKVYPESFFYDVETNDTITPSTVTTVKAYTENRTALLSSTSKPDVRLQLLAVCEGYLEIVKLIKNQNQTTEGDLDADLARYCENIISQSFNNQLEKPKKSEVIEFPPQNTNKEEETAESFSENASKLNSQSSYETARDFSESQLRKKIMAAVLENPIPTKKTAAKKNETKKMTLNDNYNNNSDNDDNDDDYDEYYVDEHESENDDNNNNNDNNITQKNEEERNITELETNEPTEAMEVDTTAEKDDNNSLIECIVQKRRKEKTEKGLSKEEIKMLQILKKRKKELLSWLKDQDKLDDLDETEFIDDENLITETKTTKNSGTIKLKSEEKGSKRGKKNSLFYKNSDFPIYAKQYGYDKGGELREVEVLWRKVNKKTHEEEVFKNISVLALFISSLNTNDEDSNLVVNDEHKNEGMPEIKLKDQSCAALNSSKSDVKTTAPAIVKISKALQNISCSALLTNKSTKSTGSNLTHTYISKPNLTSIVGESPKLRKVHSNKTLKSSSKIKVAKDLFQEYTIEFVNYAIYILPIMLTIIFLFCCLCCGLHILKAQQSLKRHRRKKKKQCITQETSDTTDECELISKKKKREVKFKNRPKNPESDAASDKKKLKKFWSILKLHSVPSNKLKKENVQKGQKNTLLRFLKDKRKKPLESYCPPLSPKEKKNDGSRGTDDWNETAKRRELIALLEEVKKIEMEKMDCKKELQSARVQCTTQNSPELREQEVFFAFQKMPKGYSNYSKPYSCQQTNPAIVDDNEFCEDVNELTQLLPCECTYLSKKADDCSLHYDFNINQQNPCTNFLKIFRDSGICHDRSFNEKNFVKNESENRSFIFNKYKSISMDPREELMGVTQKNAGTEMRLTNIAPSFALPSQKNADILKEIDNLKRQLNNKKNIHLKDDGVLCRL